MTVVHGVARDPENNTISGAPVAARLVAASPALLAGGEVVGPAITSTGTFGAWSLDLIPIEALVVSEGAYYVLLVGDDLYKITVPSSGPVEITDVLVEPGPLPATGVSLATFLAFAAKHPPGVILEFDDPLPTVDEPTIIYRKQL